MIKFIVLDVDGTLTDGKLYLSESGEMFKVFDIRDGGGIKDILPKLGIIPIVITARSSKIVENRCLDLEINEFYQGIRNKEEKLQEILFKYNKNNKELYSLENVAYIGDDLIDIPCMLSVKKAGGIVGCPNNAANEVIKIANYVCEKNGGNGAIREFIEYLEKNI